MRRFLSLVWLLTMFASAQAGENSTEENWSPVVNGLRARLYFAEGFATHGDLFLEVYLELHNTASVITPTEFQFDAAKFLHFELSTSDGKAVPEPAMKYGGNGFSVGPYTLTIPHEGTLRFPVTWSGFGFPENFGMILRFENASWKIAREDQTRYFLLLTLEVPRMHADLGKGAPWSGVIKTPPVQVPAFK